MKAHLLTIGDELLIGQTTNTNAAWLGEQLTLLGVDVLRSVTVGDEGDAIQRELDRAYADVPLVITTGGLGPTHDDLTKTIVADYFGRDVVRRDDLLERVRHYYERRGRTMPEKVAGLADVPDGFSLLDNPVGTAPGLWYAENGDAGERILVVLPGVPREMKEIFSASVVPRLTDRTDLRDVQHRTLLTSGVPESQLQSEIGDLESLLGDDLKLAYLPSTSGVRLRITAYGEDEAEAEARLDRLEDELRDRVGRHIFGTGDETLEGVVGEMLRERGLMVATAESATGGLVGHRITSIPGSSDYFVGGVVSYAYAMKHGALNVSYDDLKGGAVAEEVALAMARGVRDLAMRSMDAYDAVVETDEHRAALPEDVIGIATTGVAGPGGSDDKPAGTVWVGYVDGDTEYARRLQFVDDRQLNKELFATSALEMIRRQLLRKDGALEDGERGEGEARP